MLNQQGFRPIKRRKQIVAYENSVSITASFLALFQNERGIADYYGDDYTNLLIMKDTAAEEMQDFFEAPLLDVGMNYKGFYFEEISTGRELDFFMPTIDRMGEVVSAYLWFHGLTGAQEAFQENDPFDDEGGIDVTGLPRFLPLLKTDKGPPIFFPENLYQFLDYLRMDRGRIRFANLFARAPLASLLPSSISESHTA